jgi:ABC-type nitrate/sulfonate/bicarbonate transport system permease component
VTAVEQTRPLPDAERALSDDKVRAERAAATRRMRRGILNIAIRVVSVVTFLVLWEIAGRGIDPVLFTTPSAVSVAAVEMIRSGELWTYLYPSLVVLL